MWIFWLIVAGICFVIEAYTVGFFVFWFGVGALIALLSSFFTSNFILQSTFFIISSVLLLFLTKPFANHFIKKMEVKPTNVYKLIGKEGIVIEDIDTLNGKGKVKVNGEIWSANSDENISSDTKIKVTQINGVRLKVEKIDK